MLAVGLEAHAVFLGVCAQVFHVVTAVVAQHDGHGHAVVEVGAGIVGVGAVGVLASGFLGCDPDVEDDGVFQDLRAEHGQGVLVAEGAGQRHGGPVRAAAGALDDDGFVLKALGIGVLLLVEHGAGLGFQLFGDGCAHFLIKQPHARRDARTETGAVDALKEILRGGVRADFYAPHQVMVVLI